jgi:hypothetical protein
MPGAAITSALQPPTLATSTSPSTKILPLSYAVPWHLVVENKSGGDLTAIRLRFRTHTNAPWTPWQSVSSGLPIPAGTEGNTISIVDPDTCAQAIEVELTAASTGVAAFWLAGVAP